MLSERTPSFGAVMTSPTWPEFDAAETFPSSGMTAPAKVPHEMIAESFHHMPWAAGIACAVSDDSPWPIRKYDTRNVRPTETIEVSHTSWVSGCSKLKLFAFW